jgi:serine protease AprX
MTKRLLLTVALGLVFCPLAGATGGRLDATLRGRADAPQGFSRVIVRTRSGCAPGALLGSLGDSRTRHLQTIGADVLVLPDASLGQLATDPCVLSVSADRPVHGVEADGPELDRTGHARGAAWVREALGLDGTGIGIAMVDSGVTAWHDDLTGPGHAGQRVVRFVDFLQHRQAPYDDYGHGTHVAGILAGNGLDSGGARAGVAPGANLVALKVLDANGDGYVSDVIAAIDYAVEHRGELNIRVMNVSVAAAPTESYTTDPLTLAARRAVEAGIVVVAAGGNLGRSDTGEPVDGGITAPGNAPWVLTVGASTRAGAAGEEDDVVAPFSSRGPTRFDLTAKPDLVAPGLGIESLSEPGSTLYETRPQMRRWGTADTAAPPYFSMSGTSMAAPVVSGTIALMLQANPALTPNAVKGILEYTAEWHAGWSTLAQGAGFLNARGAVTLARSFATGAAAANDEDAARWSRHIIWGNRHVDGATLAAEAPVWATSIVWGATVDERGRRIEWTSRH